MHFVLEEPFRGVQFYKYFEKNIVQECFRTSLTFYLFATEISHKKNSYDLCIL